MNDNNSDQRLTGNYNPKVSEDEHQQQCFRDLCENFLKRKEKPRQNDSVSQNEIHVPDHLGSSENHSSDEEAPI